MALPNPRFFIVGCARSGTTLVQRLFDAHPDVAVVNETLWIPVPLRKGIGVDGAGYVTPDLIPFLVSHRRFSRLGLEPADLEEIAAAPIRYADFVTAVFDRVAARRGKQAAADKSPAYVRVIPVLHELLPASQFVHLVRDGRDVAVSVVNWKKRDRIARDHPTWARDPIVTAALWWARNVRLGQEAGARLGPALYRDVRYEALVADPEAALRPLCEGLGLAFDDAMLRFHEGRARADASRASKSAWLPPTPGARDWRVELDPADVEAFEAAAGDLLTDLGYERAWPAPGLDARRRVTAVRASFIENVRARGSAVPAAW